LFVVVVIVIRLVLAGFAERGRGNLDV